MPHASLRHVSLRFNAPDLASSASACKSFLVTFPTSCATPSSMAFLACTSFVTTCVTCSIVRQHHVRARASIAAARRASHVFVSSSPTHLSDDVASVRPSIFRVQLALASFLVASVARYGRNGRVHVLREATNVADGRQNDDETKEMPTRLRLLAHLSVKLELTLEIVGGLRVERKFTKGSEEGALGSLRRCLRWCFRRSLRNGKDGRTTGDVPQVVASRLDTASRRPTAEERGAVELRTQKTTPPTPATFGATTTTNGRTQKRGAYEVVHSNTRG